MLVGKNSHTFHLKVRFLALLEPSIPPEGELYNLSLVKGLAWKAWREVHVYSLKMVEGWMNLNNIIQISPELHDWSNWHLPDAFFMIIFITDFTSQTFATPVMTETQYMNSVNRTGRENPNSWLENYVETKVAGCSLPSLQWTSRREMCCSSFLIIQNHRPDNRQKIPCHIRLWRNSNSVQ